MTQSKTDNIKRSTLVIAIFATIMTTILTLEFNGLIKHNSNKQDYQISDYKAIFIEKQENKQYRLSHKPSKQTAICNNGYLFITSDINNGMQGLLVDYKNRGVKCIPGIIK